MATRSQFIGQDDQLAFCASDIELTCQEQDFQSRPSHATDSNGMCSMLLCFDSVLINRALISVQEFFTNEYSSQPVPSSPMHGVTNERICVKPNFAIWSSASFGEIDSYG